MGKKGVFLLLLAVLTLTFLSIIFTSLNPSVGDQAKGTESFSSNTFKLPPPSTVGSVSVEQALAVRRSVRTYVDEPLRIDEVSQLLWAAQGITSLGGQRTAPSAGALYPLEIYCLIGDVEDVPKGVYKYIPSSHEVKKIIEGDFRTGLSQAALNQQPVQEAPVSLIIAAVYERTTVKYGDRGIRYVHMEAGHTAQNVYLQAVSLNLGTVAIGAFSDSDVKKVVHMADDEEPLYIMPVGRIV